VHGFRQSADVSKNPVHIPSSVKEPRVPAKRMLQGIRAAQHRERQQLLSEFSKIRGLMPLLMKSRNGQRWSPAERDALRGQLRAIAYLSPYLLIMLLPGSFLAVPVLAWWLDRRRRNRSDRAPPPHGRTDR